ncbi:MAG: hypothetical protein HZA46_13530 [Planctomycetales bacterium]|nr:hypothetical protein [Planctomycetales bacterium]
MRATLIRQRWWTTLVSLVLTGCGQVPSDIAPSVLGSEPLFVQPGEPLSDAEIEQFFRVIAKLPEQKMPEFAPAANEADVDLDLPAEQLADDFRNRFRNLFDANKQGALWAEDSAVAAAMREQHLTPSQFAALTASISCAIARVRLDSQYDVAALCERGHVELARLTSEFSLSADAAKSSSDRDVIALRLGKIVALVEFLDLLNQVPDHNRDLVRRHASRLVVLLPSRGTFNESFPEFELWAAKQSPSAIQPASFEEPAGR